MNADFELAVQYACARSGVPHRHSVTRWIASTLKCSAMLTVRYVDLIEARELNRLYRGRDYPTNVLSFGYEAPGAQPRRSKRPSRAAPLQGDIVICPTVVAREAQAQGKPLRAHHAHLVIHGVLHLQGYDHENAADARMMEAREQAILNALGYADPYREHASTAAPVLRKRPLKRPV